MVAVDLLTRLHELGAELVLIDGGKHARLRPGKVPIPPELVNEIRLRKDEVRELAREREAVVQHAEGILTENAAIREGKFPLPEPKFCGFHIGASGRDCKRCGGSWLEHYASPSPSARTKRGAR